MVCRHAHVGSSFRQQRLYRRQNAADGTDLAAVGIDVRRRAEEVPEQLIGAVDEVNFDGVTLPARTARPRCLALSRR
jgi:hypothetical protein